MPGLLPNQVDDFVTNTLPKFKRYKWTDLSTEFQHYACTKFFNKREVTEDASQSIDFRVKVRNTGNAHLSGMFAQDQTRVEDVMISASVPWSMTTTSFSYDIYEKIFQTDMETIIKQMMIRDHDAMTDMVELMEQHLWSSPASPQDQRPRGLPHWIVKNPTAVVDGGFTGGNPAGFTGGAAGISSTTTPRWSNWAFGYTNVTVDDMVKKVKKALAFTNFVPAVPHPQLGFGKASYEMFTTYRVQEQLERLAETRNDRLGSDVARYINEVTIGGVPVYWIPYLEQNDLTDPIYGVNWSAFRPYVKKGCNMRRNPPKDAPNQHTVRNVFIDHWHNYICYNRRLCFVGSK